MSHRAVIYRGLLEETAVEVLNEEDEEETDVEADSMEKEEDMGRIQIYVDENPYEMVEINEETGVYQVIGNEIILLTRAHGFCCICCQQAPILYMDNSYGLNIAAQLCLPCIHKMMNVSS